MATLCGTPAFFAAMEPYITGFDVYPVSYTHLADAFFAKIPSKMVSVIEFIYVAIICKKTNAEYVIRVLCRFFIEEGSHQTCNESSITI